MVSLFSVTKAPFNNAEPAKSVGGTALLHAHSDRAPREPAAAGAGVLSASSNRPFNPRTLQLVAKAPPAHASPKQEDIRPQIERQIREVIADIEERLGIKVPRLEEIVYASGNQILSSEYSAWVKHDDPHRIYVNIENSFWKSASSGAVRHLLTHELLHNVSAKFAMAAKDEISERQSFHDDTAVADAVVEGFTEYFATKVTGTPSTVADYREERSWASQLIDAVGERTAEQAFLFGDTRSIDKVVSTAQTMYQEDRYSVQLAPYHIDMRKPPTNVDLNHAQRLQEEFKRGENQATVELVRQKLRALYGQDSALTRPRESVNDTRVVIALQSVLGLPMEKLPVDRNKISLSAPPKVITLDHAVWLLGQYEVSADPEVKVLIKLVETELNRQHGSARALKGANVYDLQKVQQALQTVVDRARHSPPGKTRP